MTIVALTALQIAQILFGAGFRGDGLATMTALGLVESRGLPNATGYNTDGSYDRGIFQLNSYWHREVSDSCAYDPVCAAQAVYRITNGGTDFSAYQPDITLHRIDQFLPQAQAAAAQVSASSSSLAAPAAARVPWAGLAVAAIAAYVWLG